MKVGKLRVFRCCGLFDIVIGPNPIKGFLVTSILFTLFAGVLILMTAVLPQGIFKTIAFIGVSVTAAFYVRLCTSNPGIPEQFLDSAFEDNSISKSSHNKICERC